MGVVPIFTGLVTAEARLEFTAAEAQLRRAHLRSLIGREVEIVVRKKRTQRSDDQNAYLHAVPFALIAEYTGHSIEEVKVLLMGECWGWQVVQGRQIPVKPSTSSMTTEECSYFIEWLPPWALDHLGLDIPLPEKATRG